MNEYSKMAIVEKLRKRAAELEAVRRWIGDIVIDYHDEDIDFEIAIPDHRIAIESRLTAERANAARDYKWKVVWVNEYNLGDFWDIVDDVIGELFR